MRRGPRTALTLTVAACCTAAAALTGCGGPGRDGYTAVGAAAPGPERGAGENVAPRGGLEFQSLPAPTPPAASDSATALTSPGSSGFPAPGGSAGGGASAADPGGSVPAPGTPRDPAGPPPQTGTGGAGGTGGSGGSGTSGGSGDSGGTGSSSGSGGSGNPPGTPPTSPPGTGPGTRPPTTTPPPPASPARVTVGAPIRAAASERRCERVTVTFTNTGGTAVRSGTVSFATHIIGALGVDWATVTTTQPLPAPLAGGASKTQTYTVCVEAWRVPLGMRVETRAVTAGWS
ncbi:hypothetical protein [Streptomyces sp. NPDC048606]|uniref:hypothetical protein n=1 Tax=Streptomyces sp. NPDC048606 TaxID=3154726 RepID=UPI00342DB811